MVRIKVVSLFSGCGGGDIGIFGGFCFKNMYFHEHNVEIVYSGDISAKAVKIYNDNFKQKAKVEDIRLIESESVPDHDILVAGFPCQSFSIVAQNPPRLGIDSDGGRLFYEVSRILECKKPRAFILENVKGILSANHGEAFKIILRELRESGYVVSYRLLDASDFGAPQKRKRVFIVGVRKDIGVKPAFPRKKFRKPKYVLKDVLMEDDLVPEKYFFSERAIAGLENTKNKQLMNKGRIQNPNSTCATVSAHLAKVSLNSVDPVVISRGKIRRFTPREVARIQTFPENFKLEAKDADLYKCLGNAIPPVLMWYVTDSLLRKVFPEIAQIVVPSRASNEAVAGVDEKC